LGSNYQKIQLCLLSLQTFRFRLQRSANLPLYRALLI